MSMSVLPMRQNAMKTKLVITILEDQVVFVVTADMVITVPCVSKQKWYVMYSFSFWGYSLDGKRLLKRTVAWRHSSINRTVLRIATFETEISRIPFVILIFFL